MSTEENYQKRIENSVKKGLAFMERDPKQQGLQFVFNLTAHGSLDTTGHNIPAEELLNEMDRLDHSQSSMNITFAKLVEAAIDAGRPVETKRVAGQLRTYIKPREIRM